MTRSLSRIAAALALLLGAADAAAAVPTRLSFSARLADAGTAVTGNHDFVFRLFGGAFGGAALWQETQTGVPVDGGVVATVLGASSPLDAVLGGSSSLFLEVTYDGTTLSPRLELLSVPFATRAGSAGSAAVCGQADSATSAATADRLGTLAPADVLTVVDAAGTYVTKTDAAATYLPSVDALATFLSKTDAAINYVTKVDAAAAYVTKVDAASTYLTSSGAATTYLSKVDAASTYQLPLGAGCPVGQYLRGFSATGTPTCAIAVCPMGMADCDGLTTNGCETDLLTDANCGACGNACAASEHCTSTGRCQGMLSPAEIAQISAWASYSGSWNLCYRASRDGWAATTFHAKCDNRGASFFVVKTSSGIRYGGFTSLPWNGASAYSADATAFIFSLTNGVKHAQVPANAMSAVYRNSSYGPTLGGGHDIFLGTTTLGSGAYCNLGYTYACRVGTYASSACQNDLCGSYSPVVAELEVFTANP